MEDYQAHRHQQAGHIQIQSRQQLLIRGVKMRWTILVFLIKQATTFAATTISPVLLKITPNNKITSFEIRNSNTTNISFQIDICDWDNCHIDKIGSIDPNWIISPKIISIPPNGKQIIRLTQRNISSQATEQKKRLLVREIETTPNQKGIKIKSNYSIPLFARNTKPQIDKKPYIKANGDILVITNESNTFITLGRLYNRENSLVIGGYVPAHESKTVKLPFSIVHGSYKLDYQIDDTSKTLSF